MAFEKKNVLCYLLLSQISKCELKLWLNPKNSSKLVNNKFLTNDLLYKFGTFMKIVFEWALIYHHIASQDHLKTNDFLKQVKKTIKRGHKTYGVIACQTRGLGHQALFIKLCCVIMATSLTNKHLKSPLKWNWIVIGSLLNMSNCACALYPWWRGVVVQNAEFTELCWLVGRDFGSIISLLLLPTMALLDV